MFWISSAVWGSDSPEGRYGSRRSWTSALARMGAMISGVSTLARSTRAQMHSPQWPGAGLGTHGGQQGAGELRLLSRAQASAPPHTVLSQRGSCGLTLLAAPWPGRHAHGS